jgi:NAD+ synthetase
MKLKKLSNLFFDVLLISNFLLSTFVFQSFAKEKNNKPLKIAMLQFDPIAGDLDYNENKIRLAYERAVKDGADILITPELADVGYSYGDYLQRPEIWQRAADLAERMQKMTQGQTTALLLGHIAPSASSWGKPLQNVASAFVDGKLAYRHAKMLLPDYDVYNDARWFHAGEKAKPWHFKGYRIGVAICEDWWFEDKFSGPQGPRRYYKKSPADIYAKKGVDLALSLSASPYGQDKQAYRENIHADVARKLKAPFIWNGMSGATDGVIYDGRSFILNSKGETVDRLAMFMLDYALVDFPQGPGKDLPINVIKDSIGMDTNPEEAEVVLQALLSGIREYVRRTGSKGFVLGVSGGIDSAVVAALVSMAIGPENLIAVSLPSKYSPDHSKSDAFDLIRHLGVPESNMHTISIEEAHEAFKKSFGEKFWIEEATIDENTQARIRMTILNGIANRFPGYTVAVTGNKTEYAMGYFTFGGDDKGGLGILADLWKSEVYELARYINKRAGKEVIPYNTINKPASPDLKNSQVSYGSPDGMPRIDVLDPLLQDYYEHLFPLQKLYEDYTGYQLARGPDWVKRVIDHSERMDYKRRQSAPHLRVSRRKTFDWVARRVPIAKQNIHAPIQACESALVEKNIVPRAWFKNTLGPTLNDVK